MSDYRPTNYRIVEDDLTGPEVAALLGLHLADMHQWSPACKVHAMPIERLRQPDVTFFSAWDGGTLAAVGALKALGDARGELKSMRAAPEYRGKGAGKAILEHMLAEARRRGYTWLGLETGRTEPFRPAIALYRKHGFAECGKFGDYLPDDFSQCMARAMTHLRPATQADTEALSNLGRDSFLAAFGHLYRPADLAAFIEQVYSVESVAAEIADPTLTHRLAADAPGGALTGYVKLRQPSHFAAHSRAENPIELGQLYTDPRRTGEGIGAALMDWALGEARARGCDAMLLSVWSENHGAQRFYQRLGFRHVADIDFWVGNHRDDEFLYELSL